MSTMGVKIGTKTWSDRPEGSTPDRSGGFSLTPEEQKALGEKDLGSVLNKVADPNWIDPSKKNRGVGNDKLDKDAFFKLMLTQLKSQDPTNPLKSHEMAAQLAQFSSLEQMTNINQTLAEMKNAQKPVENFHSLNLIGKTVAGDSSKLTRTQFDKEHDFKFNLPVAAQEVEVKVRNSDGEVIRTYKQKEMKAGANQITWNGENENGQKMQPGEYDFIVEAKNAAGQKIAVRTQFEGQITGISFSSDGPILQVGNQSIKFSDVSKITDPSLMMNDQKKSQDLKSQTEIEQTEKVVQDQASAKNSENPAPAKSNILNNVGLSREMMQKIQNPGKSG